MPAAALALDDAAVFLLLAAVLVAGTFFLRPLLVSLAAQIPVVGPALSSRVDSVISGFLIAITPAANAALPALTGMLDWLNGTWSQLAATVTGLAQLASTGLFRLTTWTIPHALDGALAQAETLVADEASHSEALAAGVAAGARQLIDVARSDTAALVAQAEGLAVSEAQGAEARAGALFGVAEADAVALAAQGRAELASEAAALTGYVDTLFGQAVAIGNAAEAALRGDLAGVAGQLGADLQGGVSALEQEIARARTALSAANVASVAVVAADVAAIRAMRCMQACDVLGAAGEGLQLLDLAAILALVGAARSDPAGVQAFFVNEVAPAVQGIAAAI
jgi:hypothetical protein